MKQLAGSLLAVLLLTGCSRTDGAMEQAMHLRSRLLSEEASFTAEVTADYGQEIYTFTMDCRTDRQGTLRFTVTDPQELDGITGTVAETGAALTFDGQALAFPMLADGQLSPVGAPWMVIHTLRSGYLKTCSQASPGMRLELDDRYEEDALQLSVWTDETLCPREAEILWDGRRILSLRFQNFRFV